MTKKKADKRERTKEKIKKIIIKKLIFLGKNEMNLKTFRYFCILLLKTKHIISESGNERKYREDH